MHREISHADQSFAQESRLPLYLLTALLGLLIGLDLWPAVASWALARGMSLPSWPREFYGYRIALVAAVLGGARILYGSLESLLEGRIGADLALAIACVAAILINEPLVAAEVVFIGMVGECLESITFERTQRAVRRIVEVSPRRCWLLRDGQEVRVLTSEVQVGDRVVVKPGGRVPVDGVVVDGRSAVDTSALTGESLPADKGAGDEVLAGSLNQFGALTVEARRVAEHTVVGRVIELTARALKDKAPLERTADRLARYFLPAVLGLAALTFLVTLFYHVSPWIRPAGAVRLSLGEAARLSIYPTLAVLVVACPCALILATPAAIIAALGRLAGTGVLIKGGSALERLAAVNAFAFDKTGTLTEGRLELGDVIGLNGVSADELLTAAATAEQRSEHLLARLITDAARSRGLTPAAVEDFLAHPGAGVTARTATGKLVVGTRRLLEEQGVVVPAEAAALLEQLDAAGQSTLLVARDGVMLGVIGARDRVRPEAAAMLAELRTLGIHDIALLTGDREAVARSLAEQLHITEVHAQLLPAEKAEFIAAWARTDTPEGAAPTARRAAMVGDGINDAPALARAHVGLAIGGSGTDVAAEAGDVVFMGEPLLALPLLLRLSRETVRIIRQNILIFAFGVNAFGILLTAWLWPLLAPAEWYEQAPVAAVIYHQLGSLAVLLNAMRLLGFERWGKVRHVVGTVDQWMEHHLDLGEFFHWLGHHWRPLGGAATLVLVAGYALSGLTQIGPDELGIVRRFGQALDEDLTPGLYWRWPRPVEEVVRVQPQRVHTVEIGFRSAPGATGMPATLAWSSPHGGDGLRRMPDEAVMITGDGNLVELQATVRYHIKDPRTYLFEVREPVEVIRATTEAVLRETAAARSFGDLLTTNRDQFQRDVHDRLTQRLAEESRHGLGITLDGIALHDLHPPQDVVQAYHEVTKAMEDRDRMVNEAETRALQDERRKQSEALETVRLAEATRNEKIRLAEADQAAFLARYQARTSLPWQQEGSLLGEAFAAVRGGQPVAAAYEEYQARRRELIALQIAITDFRLFWDRLGLALSNRDKVILDADQVPGKRNLLLFDPDQLRMPIPVIAPPERSPMPGGGEGP